MAQRTDPLEHVHVVGTGLIGTSIGLGLRRQGVTVTLEDPSPTALALARDLGAGLLADEVDSVPTLVVVAAPPDVAGQVVARQLGEHPDAVVTDVSSVKAAVVRSVRSLVGREADLTRYVGSHPMAGRERSGAIAAQSDLFDGRPWVVTPQERSAPEAVAAVEALARLLGAAVRRMPAEVHDAAVAAVSHVPQVAASLVASRLRDLPMDSVGLAGQGVRDVTRIAASSPALWTQILVANAPAVRAELASLRDDLDGVIEALGALADDPEHARGARAVLARAISEGNAGHARIPGKHGPTPTSYGVVTVAVPDEPGSLARLLADVGEEGINLEDLHIEHGVGRLVGIAELLVLPAAVEPLCSALRVRGWTVHDG
jgi:prephenate dehydrogenase